VGQGCQEDGCQGARLPNNRPDSPCPSFVSASSEQTERIGALLGALLCPDDVVLLTGDLGAGKTQFTKGVARALGVSQDVTSPTFNLMHEYASAGTDKGAGGGAGGGARSVVLRHFDLYRLEDESELDDIDYFGLLEDGAISVVEWGDRFFSALPLDYLLIAFELVDERTRILRFEAAGIRGRRLLTDIGEALHVDES
jgi:tRNA threonylcarbamoyladenosine biosynthesis protein TsaE